MEHKYFKNVKSLIEMLHYIGNNYYCENYISRDIIPQIYNRSWKPSFFLARSPKIFYILHKTDKFHLEIMKNIVSSSAYPFSMFYFIWLIK